jgi:hypothetical protein
MYILNEVTQWSFTYNKLHIYKDYDNNTGETDQANILNNSQTRSLGHLY